MNEQIWTLDETTYSKSWPTGNEHYWILDKRHFEIARAISKEVMYRFDTDNSTYYGFLLVAVNSILSSMLNKGQASSLKLIDEPCRVSLDGLTLEISANDNDGSRIQTTLFYFYVQLLLKWTVEYDPNFELPILYGMNQEIEDKIVDLISFYTIK